MAHLYAALRADPEAALLQIEQDLYYAYSADEHLEQLAALAAEDPVERAAEDPHARFFLLRVVPECARTLLERDYDSDDEARRAAAFLKTALGLCAALLARPEAELADGVLDTLRRAFDDNRRLFMYHGWGDPAEATAFAAASDGSTASAFLLELLGHFGEAGGFAALLARLRGASSLADAARLLQPLVVAAEHLAPPLLASAAAEARAAVAARVRELPAAEVAATPIEEAAAAVDLLAALQKRCGAPPAEELALDLAWHYAASPLLERRISGIAEVSRVVYNEQVVGDGGEDALAAWLLERGVLDLLFGASMHAEVLSRAHTVLGFLAQRDALTEAHVAAALAAAHGKHEADVGAIMDALSAMLPFASPALLRSVLDAVGALPREERTVQTVTLVATMAQRLARLPELFADTLALSWRLALEDGDGPSSSSDGEDEEAEDDGDSNMWANLLLYQLELQHASALRAEYIRRCAADVERAAALDMLSRLLKAAREGHWLEDEDVWLLLRELRAPESTVLARVVDSAADAQARLACVAAVCAYAGAQLNAADALRLWDRGMAAAAEADERDATVRWLAVAHRICLSPATTERLLTERVGPWVRAAPAAVGAPAYTAFVRLMREANANCGALVPRDDEAEEDGGEQEEEEEGEWGLVADTDLIGLPELWELALCGDEGSGVRDAAQILLCRLFLALAPSLAGDARGVRARFVAACVARVEEHPAACLRLLRAFVDMAEGGPEDWGLAAVDAPALAAGHGHSLLDQAPGSPRTPMRGSPRRAAAGSPRSPRRGSDDVPQLSLPPQHGQADAKEAKTPTRATPGSSYRPSPATPKRPTPTPTAAPAGATTPQRSIAASPAALTAALRQQQQQTADDTPPPPPPMACEGCGTCATLQACARCQRAFYCSEACQRAHWPDHRAQCSANQRLADARMLPTTLLQPHFSALFALLAREAAVAEPVWRLLCLLPTNPDMLARLAALDDGWRELLSADCGFKLLYSLKIVSALLSDSACDDSAAQSAWQHRFVAQGGARLLYRVLMDNPPAGECLALLLRTLRVFVAALARLTAPESVGDLAATSTSPSGGGTGGVVLTGRMRVALEQELLAHVDLQALTARLMFIAGEDDSAPAAVEAALQLLAAVGAYAPLIAAAELVGSAALSAWLAAALRATPAAAQTVVALTRHAERQLFPPEDVAPVPARHAWSVRAWVDSPSPSGEEDGEEAGAQPKGGVTRRLSPSKLGDQAPWSLREVVLEHLLQQLPDVPADSCAAYFSCVRLLLTDACLLEPPRFAAGLQRTLVRLVRRFRGDQGPEEWLQGALELLECVSGALQRSSSASSGHETGVVDLMLDGCVFGPLEGATGAGFRCRGAGSRAAALRVVALVTRDSEAAAARALQTSLQRQQQLEPGGVSFGGAERPPGAFVGLVNPACVCYLNSITQQLFFTQDVRRGILAAQADEDRDNVLLQLQTLFGFLQGSQRQAYDPTPFVRSVRDMDGNPTDVRVQMDADEVFVSLLDQLEQCLGEGNSLLGDTFRGKICNLVVGEECGHVSERLEEFSVLSLDVKHKQSILDSLALYVKGEKLAGDNAYACEQCDAKVPATKSACLGELPPTLVVHLKRFEFDFDTMLKHKVNSYCHFPAELDVGPFTRAGASSPDSQYMLRGVIVHIGTCDAGHYFALRHVEGQGWVELNDHSVAAFDAELMEDVAFGGDSECSAYMLVYERASGGTRVTDAPAPVPARVAAAVAADNRRFLEAHHMLEPAYWGTLERLVRNAADARAGVELSALLVSRTLAFAPDDRACVSWLGVLRRLLAQAGADAAGWLLAWAAGDDDAVRTLLLEHESAAVRERFAGVLLESGEAGGSLQLLGGLCAALLPLVRHHWRRMGALMGLVAALAERDGGDCCLPADAAERLADCFLGVPRGVVPAGHWRPLLRALRALGVPAHGPFLRRLVEEGLDPEAELLAAATRDEPRASAAVAATFVDAVELEARGAVATLRAWLLRVDDDSLQRERATAVLSPKCGLLSLPPRLDVVRLIVELSRESPVVGRLLRQRAWQVDVLWLQSWLADLQETAGDADGVVAEVLEGLCLLSASGSVSSSEIPVAAAGGDDEDEEDDLLDGFDGDVDDMPASEYPDEADLGLSISGTALSALSASELAEVAGLVGSDVAQRAALGSSGGPPEPPSD